MVRQTLMAMLAVPSVTVALVNSSFDGNDFLPTKSTAFDGRSKDCPPCFNCLLPANKCAQYASCNEFNGKCNCPDGFGGDDCLKPLCGSLGRGKDRQMRSGTTCHCDDGWTGINCNVCTQNQACDALMNTRNGGICYQNGEVVKHNHQFCKVTNRQITSLLGKQRPEVTFTCEKEKQTCDFQFWVDALESFYCHLSDCESSADFSETKNSTSYQCAHISCNCIEQRMLCGKDGSIDLSDFLDQAIQGPGGFSCDKQLGEANVCMFTEPAMNKLIHDLIGDSSILLDCQAGECLYQTEVPGYKRPVKRINTPLISGVIAACALFLAAVIVIAWLLSRRKLKHGALRLEDPDDATPELMLEHNPAVLYFENICYTLNRKTLLKGVQGVCRPGEVTAIIGASGAGKTTCLDILARKNKYGKVSGDFYINGAVVNDSEYKDAVGFVDQEDTMLPTLTVHETILNSALLRLPRQMRRADKEQRVFDVEKELGIYHVRDSLIGSEEGNGRGISGGEKRRVGIACELVTSPSILFLDEPTSGLDAYNAYNVVESLVTMAKNYRRTIIFTIHQPRSNIVALFDRLILLAAGNTIYSGPLCHCQAYFGSIGYDCPPGFNIADYLIDLTVHAAGRETSAAGIASIGTFKLESGTGKSADAIRSIILPSTAMPIPVETAFIPSQADSRRQLHLSSQNTEPLNQKRRADSPEIESTENNLDYEPQRTTSHASQLADDPTEPLYSQSNASQIDILTLQFTNSEIAKSVRAEIQKAKADVARANNKNFSRYRPEGPNINVSRDGAVGRSYAKIGYGHQFLILSQRTWKNLYRNPMLLLTHYAIAITLAVFSGYLFYGLTDDIPGFQNRLGLFFFLLALFGFSTLTSVNVFAAERLLFVRERANGYYAPATYFFSKVIFDIFPLRVVPPILMGCIVYPMTGLVPDASHFFKFLLVLVLFNLAAASICLFIGIACKDGSVANLIGSLVMLFSLLFAGFLLNHNATPSSALWLQTLSIFHYGFESLIVNEVVGLTLIDKKYGLDITVPGAAILSSFGFDNSALWIDVQNLGIFALIFIALAYAAMHVLLVEKR